jgi:ArsR family metal-binding transcriptional regulator
MDRLIDDYEIQLVEPACSPGAGRWGALANIASDISPAFPYLNAVLPDARYDHQNHVLIFKEPGQQYALRPQEIRIARVENLAHAQRVVSDIVDRINAVWQKRNTITPSYAERKLASLLDIYKLLPGTNCKQCNYLTCMAYAAALRKGSARLEQCVPLSQPEHAANRKKIQDLISPA